MTGRIRMRALQSRTATSSPTGKPLERGDSYEADTQQARDDERRGFGVRVTGKARAARSRSKTAGTRAT